MTFWRTIGLFIALGLALLLVLEWRVWRDRRREEGPGAYPHGRLIRRAFGILCLESVLVLLLLMEQWRQGAPSAWSRFVWIGVALILALLALLMALWDFREARRTAVMESQDMAAEAVGALREALRERGLDVRIEDRRDAERDEGTGDSG